MRTLKKWAVLLCVLPFLFAACGGGSSGDSADSGQLALSLTDSPGNYLSVLVTITDIYAIVSESEGEVRLEFADFTSPAIVEETADSVTVDLIQLAGQVPIQFALGDLPVGKLNQIRLVISDASLTAYEDVVGIDGNDDGQITHEVAEYPVKVPSGVQTGVKLNPRNVHIQSGSLTTLTLDFDADKSIVQLGQPDQGYDFILKPVIFIAEATGTIRVAAETKALGLNFPTGLKVAENVGAGSVVQEGSVLVANAGTTGTNSDTVVDIDISGTTPVDATGLTPFASSSDVYDGEPLVNSPSGIAQNLDLVWISNTADSASTVSEIYTDQTFSNLFVGNDAPSDSVDGLVLTSGVEFGGFAPNGSLAGDDLLVFQTNGNGSVTGIDLKDGRKFDLLGAGTFTKPSDLAFVPSSNPIAPGDPPGTAIGKLYVTDASTNNVTIVGLTTADGNVGEAATTVAAVIETTFTSAFVSEPVGIAYSAVSTRLYIANRGNGTITAVQPDGTEIETYDTGLGSDSINGIDVTSTGTEDILLLTNTAGNDDPTNDAPGVGMSSLEKVVIGL